MASDRVPVSITDPATPPSIIVTPKEREGDEVVSGRMGEEHDNEDAVACRPLLIGPTTSADFDTFDEKQLEAVPIQELRYAPMQFIVRCCILCFDEDGNLTDNCTLPNTAFLSHQWFVSCAAFVDHFLALYQTGAARCSVCLERQRRKSCLDPCTSAAAGESCNDVDSSIPLAQHKDDGVANAVVTIMHNNDDDNAAALTLRHDPVEDTYADDAEGAQGMSDADSGEQATPRPSSPNRTDNWCETLRFRTRLCHAMRYWIETYPRYFDSATEGGAVCGIVADLRRLADADGYGRLAEAMDVSKVHSDSVSNGSGEHIQSEPSYAWLRNVSVRNPMLRQVSLSFDQWTPEEIATSLTHIDQRLLRRITSLSSWVQCMVLSKPTSKERAETMSKFVKVGKKLKQLQNFNTLMSVVGGLTHTALSRLTKTTNLLAPDIRRELTVLTELLSHYSNFVAYRKVLVDCRGFRIPIIGVHLKDLIAIQTAMEDANERGWLNVRKMVQLSHVFEHLTVDLERPNNLPDANMDLINTLKVSLDIHYKEDEIYELSYKREPRSFIAFHQSPKSMVFADWAAGISSVPDQQNVRRHIATMVDAVFKHYDHDKDGYISRAEFHQIAGNFPTIDSFRDIDADKDGLISKAEMQEYFIKANQLSAAFRREFKHNFHETTFLAPTFCIHCSKLLWGIIRQGYKCKDCGIPVHRNCKDATVAECRSRKVSSPLTSASSAAGGTRLHAFGNQLAPDERKISHPDGEDEDDEPTTSGVSATGEGAASVLHHTGSQRRRLFLHIRTFQSRIRTVSTAASESPSPEPMQCSSGSSSGGVARGPTPPVLPSELQGRPAAPAPARAVGAFPAHPLHHQQLKGNSKLRTQSETTAGDGYRRSRCQSPEYYAELATLASEEVFIEEEPPSTTSTVGGAASSPPPPPASSASVTSSTTPSSARHNKHHQTECPG